MAKGFSQQYVHVHNLHSNNKKIFDDIRKHRVKLYTLQSPSIFQGYKTLCIFQTFVEIVERNLCYDDNNGLSINALL